MSKTFTYVNNIGDKKTVVIKETLGEGASGVVYKALLDGFGVVALKGMRFDKNQHLIENDLIVRKKFGEDEDPHFILVRRVILHVSMANHPFVSKYGDFIGLSDNISPSTVYCMYRCADSIDLFEMLTVSDEKYSNKLLAIFFTQLCVGLKILHNKKIAHRDIKTENIMMDEGVLKYIDFGFACADWDCFKNPNLGTPMYASPDLLKRKVPGDFEVFLKRDVYALGVTFYVMITKQNFPINPQKLTQIDNVKMLEEKYRQIVNKDIPEEWRTLILGMINPNESKRYTIEQCIANVEEVGEGVM